MTILLGILLALGVFTLVVFFHELGHFLVAKYFRVTVEEFGIGIPPRIATLYRDRSGTAYTVNALPIGGFVRMKGEDALDETMKRDNGSLASRPLYAQMYIVLAGVCMNFLFAGIIFSVLFFLGTHPLGISPDIGGVGGSRLIPDFDEARAAGIIEMDGISMMPLSWSPAQRAGMLSGDLLFAVGNTVSSSLKQSVAAINTYSQKNTAIDMAMCRGSTGTPIVGTCPGGTIVHLSIVPDKHGKIGVAITWRIRRIRDDIIYHYPLGTAISAGFEEVYRESVLTLRILGNIFGNILFPTAPTAREEAIGHLSGPIGIGNLFVRLVDYHVDWGTIWIVTAMISVNLGIFNLLPFPALDGGRFAFLLIHATSEGIFHRRLLQLRFESFVHIVGFGMLIVLSVFIAYRDILRIFF